MPQDRQNDIRFRATELVGCIQKQSKFQQRLHREQDNRRAFEYETSILSSSVIETGRKKRAEQQLEGWQVSIVQDRPLPSNRQYG